MREMFLGPRNVLRMEEALLSLLAGDIFGRTPIWGRLRLFKALYYVLVLRQPRPLLAGLAPRAREYPCRAERVTSAEGRRNRGHVLAAAVLAAGCVANCAAAKEEPL